jgi:hypothetical protein
MAVNAAKRGQRDAEKIKRRNPSVGKCEANWSDFFVAPWACSNSLVAMHEATAAAKSPKKFHIFHERHIWESTSLNKRRSPAKYSMIATSHPEQKPRVMRKTVRQAIDRRRGRQADPEETATNFRIAHYTPNLIQRFQRNFVVCMHKPENIAVCGAGSDVHLFRTAALAASDNLITEALRQLIGAVSARAIDYNDFGGTGSFAQIREKRAYRLRLVENRNDNRDLH